MFERILNRGDGSVSLLAVGFSSGYTNSDVSALVVARRDSRVLWKFASCSFTGVSTVRVADQRI